MNVNIRLNVVKALLVCNVVSVMLTMKNNVVGVAGKTLVGRLESQTITNIHTALFI